MIRIISEKEALTALGRSVDRVGEAMGISAPIVADVRLRGDEALKEYRQRFDLVALNEPLYLDAGGELDADLQQAVEQASRNIQSFAEAQLVTSWMSEFSDGRSLGQVVRPLNSVGVYVPSGRYPLISTLLMAVIPAQVAGVPNIVVACPHPSREILAVAKNAWRETHSARRWCASNRGNGVWDGNRGTSSAHRWAGECIRGSGQEVGVARCRY